MLKMPKVKREATQNLTAEELKIVNLVIKKDDRIKASKPKINDFDSNTGKAAYVWRMVCFMVSPKTAHMCMPCTADFDLPAHDSSGRWSASIAREMAEKLDKLVDMIVDAVDKSEWHGVHRWAKVL